jgi:bacterioferritin
MKGNEKVIELLNDLLTSELTAINQYFLHARLCEHWGFQKLWSKIRAESIDEMKHADLLISRILFLEGLPNLQRYGKVNVGQDVPEMFRLDLEVENTSVRTLNDGVALCRSINDNGTLDLLEKILVESEQHASWLETQLDLIKAIGAENYLAQQVNP